MGVRVDLNVSLDGYATTEGGTPENPMGEDWTQAHCGLRRDTRTFRERVFHDTSGEGTTGIDDQYAAAYFEGIGAEIMGAGMFGFHTCFPMTRTGRAGGATSHRFACRCSCSLIARLTRSSCPVARRFISLLRPLHEVLARATAVAGGKDVRVGGGVSTVRDFLKAGLVDRLHVAIAPILLGRGINLWSDLRGFEDGYQVRTETAESGTVHVTFTRSS